MIQLPYNKIACEPIFDSDLTPSGLLYVPDTAKERCDQGIVKYVGIQKPNEETGELHFLGGIQPGDYVLFSGYTGTLVELEDEGLLIIMPVEFIIAKILPPVTDIEGLYFKDKEGNYFTATHEMVMKLIANNYKNEEWRRKFKVSVPKPEVEDYDRLRGG